MCCPVIYQNVKEPKSLYDILYSIMSFAPAFKIPVLLLGRGFPGSLFPVILSETPSPKQM